MPKYYYYCISNNLANEVNTNYHAEYSPLCIKGYKTLLFRDKHIVLVLQYSHKWQLYQCMLICSFKCKWKTAVKDFLETEQFSGSGNQRPKDIKLRSVKWLKMHTLHRIISYYGTNIMLNKRRAAANSNRCSFCNDEKNSIATEHMKMYL